jgi:NADPH-dependent 2,4-dienoyl-CoA reductase/sulfur reductase-like enzyme
LLLLYATQVLRAGGRIAGVLDIADPASRWRALPHLPRALRAMGELRKGIAWRREIARARIPWLPASELRANGDSALQSVSFRTAGRDRTEQADLLLLHDGVVPSLQLTRALGCDHVWDATERCWKPSVDGWGRTSRANILVAGDGAGIAGAKAAALSGRLAALAVAAQLGRISIAARNTAARPLLVARQRHRALRPLLDTLFASRPRHLDDSTLVCRCEEVTAGQIREAARLGCSGLNQLKAYTRCGMGPCQGRMCGATAASVLAAARNVPEATIEPYRTRFPSKPLTVGELAAMAEA